MKLSAVREFVLSLPSVTEAPHFHRTSFRVKGKIIVTAEPDDRFLNVMVGESVREPALAMHGDCLEKLFRGKKVMGLRVDLETAEADVVRELLRQAWQEEAPKSGSNRK